MKVPVYCIVLSREKKRVFINVEIEDGYKKFVYFYFYERIFQEHRLFRISYYAFYKQSDVLDERFRWLYGR